MTMSPFALISPSTRGLSLALTRHLLRTTDLTVFATHRSDSPDAVRRNILSPLPHVDANRLRLLHCELTSEDSIAAAAQDLADALGSDADGGAHLDTAFFAGGILNPERQPADLDASTVEKTFQINVISHLLLIKHFSRFLPPPSSTSSKAKSSSTTKWVHVSARVGSVSDNRLGGWYSYRASKAALNQVIRTFDLYLQQKKIPAMCVGVHPGTVKTDLSRVFWDGVPENKLFEPDFAAERIVDVVRDLDSKSRGRVWDWAGKEVVP
ncbi:NAD(P)-binding protein [Laetiporus sulphureus 93-53]|uniref:NAD(P)-binding protein n=1 Tax=Laetiporus sulphureus 93-53 TaxID=1314785 RepID=A0A165IDG3_9APHY|nr:NAD(P)-binding protein [Laetiporus sulphureus 93-53]KZT12929.1 NAD(P)-binding protein [Laetiporus sulphureus 93-53]